MGCAGGHRPARVSPAQRRRLLPTAGPYRGELYRVAFAGKRRSDDPPSNYLGHRVFEIMQAELA
jgi:hypothetical protein